MTTYEIEDQFNATIAKADTALKNGWISKAEHATKTAKAHSWRRKAETGHWDYIAYRNGA